MTIEKCARKKTQKWIPSPITLAYLALPVDVGYVQSRVLCIRRAAQNYQLIAGCVEQSRVEQSEIYPRIQQGNPVFRGKRQVDPVSRIEYLGSRVECRYNTQFVHNAFTFMSVYILISRTQRWRQSGQDALTLNCIGRRQYIAKWTALSGLIPIQPPRAQPIYVKRDRHWELPRRTSPGYNRAMLQLYSFSTLLRFSYTFYNIINIYTYCADYITACSRPPLPRKKVEAGLGAQVWVRSSPPGGWCIHFVKNNSNG